jgi:ABC-2 type transport system ATP-binding protein
LETNRLEAQVRIGYLPEHSPLYPEMSVVEYLGYVCELRSIPLDKRRAAINSAVDRTGLRDRALDTIGTLSKGYRQRVGVAQAILHNPEILIMDEATSGLDPAQIQGMRDLILELSKDAAVVLSTHIMQEVEAVCSRVLIISHGKLVADAELSELRNSQRIVVAVDQDAAKVAPVLRTLSGVEVMECLKESDGSRVLLQCGTEAARLIPEVARLVVQQGWQLRQLGREQRSLEHIFREVSK